MRLKRSAGLQRVTSQSQTTSTKGLAADRIRDAVPLRRGPPRTDWPQDVMIMGICPKDGSGLLKFRWKTRRWVACWRQTGEAVHRKLLRSSCSHPQANYI